MICGSSVAKKGTGGIIGLTAASPAHLHGKRDNIEKTDLAAHFLSHDKGNACYLAIKMLFTSCDNHDALEAGSLDT